ncbi:hypothetical protein BGZ76_005226, partial [Entomortierella beljakovae]
MSVGPCCIALISANLNSNQKPETKCFRFPSLEQQLEGLESSLSISDPTESTLNHAFKSNAFDENSILLEEYDLDDQELFSDIDADLSQLNEEPYLICGNSENSIAEPSRSRLKRLQAVLKTLLESEHITSAIDGNWVQKSAYAGTDITPRECDVVAMIANILRPYVLKRYTAPEDQDPISHLTLRAPLKPVAITNPKNPKIPIVLFKKQGVLQESYIVKSHHMKSLFEKAVKISIFGITFTKPPKLLKGSRKLKRRALILRRLPKQVVFTGTDYGVCKMSVTVAQTHGEIIEHINRYNVLAHSEDENLSLDDKVSKDSADTSLSDDKVSIESVKLPRSCTITAKQINESSHSRRIGKRREQRLKMKANKDVRQALNELSRQENSLANCTTMEEIDSAHSIRRSKRETLVKFERSRIRTKELFTQRLRTERSWQKLAASERRFAI